MIVLPVRAIDTDPDIPWELFRHYTFYNPTCSGQNKLLLHLVGTFDNPVNTQLFPSLAANSGFHVLSLKYNNDVAAQTPCAMSPDLDCHYNFRREILEGFDYSSEVDVNEANSIENRLIKLLQYMQNTQPLQGWEQYFTNNSIHWEMVTVSGHSQGGGHAATLGIDRPLNGVLMFGSPNDFSVFYDQPAPWTSLEHLTPDSVYFSFNNINDGVAPFDWQYESSLNIGLLNYGDSTNVENLACPYNNSHILYSDTDSGALGSHASMIRDDETPLDLDGNPLYTEVWSYMLGLGCDALSIIENSPLVIKHYPNPANQWLRIELGMTKEPYSYQIVNALNSTVQSGTMRNENSLIDLANLSSGIYLVRVRSQRGFSTFTLIKQ
ncbi:MAG: T9SS type A sorting domain-containing protein [Bacteroidota bacterium]